MLYGRTLAEGSTCVPGYSTRSLPDCLHRARATHTCKSSVNICGREGGRKEGNNLGVNISREDAAMQRARRRCRRSNPEKGSGKKKAEGMHHSVQNN